MFSSARVSMELKASQGKDPIVNTLGLGLSGKVGWEALANLASLPAWTELDDRLVHFPEHPGVTVSAAVTVITVSMWKPLWVPWLWLQLITCEFMFVFMMCLSPPYLVKNKTNKTQTTHFKQQTI